MENDLVVGVRIGEASRGSIVAAGAPLDVEVAIGRGAGCGGEDAVVARRAGDLVHRKGEDCVGEISVGQTAAVEEVVGRTQGQVAVGTGRGRGEGITVKADGEGKGEQRAAVVAVVTDVGRTGDDGTAAVGDVIVLLDRARRGWRRCRSRRWCRRRPANGSWRDGWSGRGCWSSRQRWRWRCRWRRRRCRCRTRRGSRYDYVFRVAGDAVGKDGHQGWAGRKIIYRCRSKGGVRPACYWIHREKGDLAVVDGAQLDYGIIR